MTHGHSSRRAAIALIAALAGAGCAEDGARSPGAPAPPAGRFRFEDVGEAAGVVACAWCGRPEKPHILESGGSGLALFDAEGDGDLDLYVVRAWRLDGERVVERAKNVLYRNRGDGTFEDVTEKAGVGDDGWGNGVAVGDPDGDGKPDLFVSNFGPDVLYRNRGDGTFARVEGAPSIDGWSTGAAFFDADGDGDQDLFVAAYIHATLEQVLRAKPTLDWKGTKVMFGPFGLEGEANRYFRNDGVDGVDGVDATGGVRFVEATKAAGLVDAGLYYSFGVAALDLDGDLDIDLYVANDSNPNYLYRNDGAGKFTEMGLWSGAALSAGGVSQAGMGVAVGDVDGDALPDLFVTNFADDASTLYRNRGRCLFEDRTAAAGLYEPTFKPLSWGTALADFDLDGDLDLIVANGHIYPQADTTPGSGTTFAQRNLLFEHDGGKFRDATEESGPGLALVRSSRGLAVGDLDGDGDLDVVVSNMDAPPSVLRNETPRRGSYLIVDAPGSIRAVVEAGAKRFVRETVAGGSFCSVSDPRHHFGLGPATRVDRLTIVWPDGKTTVRENLEANRSLRVDRPR